MRCWYTFNNGSKGFFETELPFQYSTGDNVIGWLHDEDKKSLGMTTVTKYLLVPIGRLSLKLVNEYIQIKYPEIELVKGKGYFYIFSNDDTIGLKLAGLFTTSIDVCHLNQASIVKWREMVEYVLRDSQRIEYDREPVYPL